MLTFDYRQLHNPTYTLDGLHPRDPAVIINDDLAYLFFTLYDQKQVTWHIGMATTEDFIHYSDYEIVSPEGYASPGNVFRVGSRWALCYQQYRNMPHYLCLAYSDDLRHWSDPQFCFNTAGNNLWNIDARTIDPYIVPWNGEYYCYYTGSTRWYAGSGHNLIGVARSTDLAHWQDLAPDKPTISVDFDWEQPDGNENNCVIRYHDHWLMLYSAGLRNQRIAWALSDDLVHWQKQGLCTVPELPGSDGTCGAPFIIEGLGQTEQHYMIYQAKMFGTNDMVFAIRESTDFIHWH